MTTKNKKPDAKYQQEKLQKENNERDILQMEFTFKLSESLFSVDRSNYSLHGYIVHN